MGGDIKQLLGTTIERVTFEKSSGILFFATDRGVFKGEPWGDCCSSCYVQHVSGTDALAVGAIVTDIQDIDDLPPVPEAEVNDVTDNWGHRITTTKGVCSIEMRLDHNGYYGGSLELELFNGEPKGTALDDF